MEDGNYITDIGTMDYPPSITDIIEIKGFQFILIRKKSSKASGGDWKEREGLEIERIRHSPDNKPTTKCPYCGRDKDFKCDSEEMSEYFEKIACELKLIRVFDHPKDLTK